MQFLMQMSRNAAKGKGFAAQPNRGLNSPGGSASRAGGPLSGNAAGKGAGGRSVNQAAGVIENAPAEFRDALENYYHGLEQSKE
jgi:membrane protein involved in colicin uptake